MSGTVIYQRIQLLWEPLKMPQNPADPGYFEGVFVTIKFIGERAFFISCYIRSSFASVKRLLDEWV